MQQVVNGYSVKFRKPGKRGYVRDGRAVLPATYGFVRIANLLGKFGLFKLFAFPQLGKIVGDYIFYALFV